jgi:hypothetical protein
MTPSRLADKLRVLRRMLWLVGFSTLTVLLGNVVLIGVPQARETLLAIDDGSGLESLLRFALFCGAYLYWAFTAWLVARLMVGRRFVRDIVQPPPGSEGFASACACWIPRALGLAATVPLAVVMFFAYPVYGAVMAGIAVVFGAFLIFRHRVPWLRDPHRAEGQSAYRCFDRMSVRARGWLALLFVISWLVFLATWFWPVAAGRAIGAPVLLLVALGAWTLFGSIVLAYWPNRRGWWTWNWAPLALIAIGAFFDNHRVASPPRDAQAVANAALLAGWRVQRPGLEAHFTRWMLAQAAGEPVYFVAVAGGASRSAYWAAMALGQLEDEARKQGRRFGDNVFLISGISGGSLGAAAFTTTLAAAPAGRAAEWLDTMLGRDYLGPVVGMMLYPDLVQRGFPLLERLRPADRSRALEAAWASDWIDTGAAFGITATPWWSEPLTQVYRSAGERRLPSLVLNTVRLDDGQRMLQSNLAFELPEAFDLLGPGFDTEHLTLAGAVHNSARFPYISPAGRVLRADGTPWGRLGDGGYHEATGAATLADVIERLMQRGLIARDDKGRPFACKAPPACEHPLVVLMLDNQPSLAGPVWQRGADGRPRRVDPTAPAQGWPLPEVSAPPMGLVRGWTSNGTRAEWRLSRLAGEAPGRYVELRFVSCPLGGGGDQPSMTWHLKKSSRELMKRVAAQGCGTATPANEADEALRANLQRLRGWIRDPAAQTPQPP